MSSPRPDCRSLDVEAHTKILGEFFFAPPCTSYPWIRARGPAGSFNNLQPDGSIHYLEKDEIDRATATSHTFDDIYVVYEKPGDPSTQRCSAIPSGRFLDDKHFDVVLRRLIEAPRREGRRLGHDEGREPPSPGRRTSNIRTYLATHAKGMISHLDRYYPSVIAKANGLVQETYGTFNGPAPYGMTRSNDADADFKQLFKDNPEKPSLGFYFGYWDVGIVMGPHDRHPPRGEVDLIAASSSGVRDQRGRMPLHVTVSLPVKSNTAPSWLAIEGRCAPLRRRCTSRQY